MFSVIKYISLVFLIPTLGHSHGLDRASDQFFETVDCRLSREWSEVPCNEGRCPIDGKFSDVACKLEYEGRGYSASDYGVIYISDKEACIVMDEASLIFPHKRRCYSLLNSNNSSSM